MRRLVLLLSTMAAALALASGVALAANIQGDAGDNRLAGTDGTDTISGGSGDDVILGRADRDRLFGDAGDDVYGDQGDDRLQVGLGQDGLFGNGGNDLLNSIDGKGNDPVDCGPGPNDVAGIDFNQNTFEGDGLMENCERAYAVVLVGSSTARGGSGVGLSGIDTRAEAERAEADGLLRQIR